MSLEILKPGLYSTIQDHGRGGYAQQGIPLGGVIDRESYNIVNALLGNQDREPVIEATLLGPTIRFTETLLIAITGSDLSPMINRSEIELYHVHRVHAGDVLSFGRVKYGCRCYIGISGVWQVAKWLGSSCPLTYGDILRQNILHKGSIIKLKPRVDAIIPTLTIPSVIDHTDTHELSISRAPEFDWFSEDLIESLTDGIYSVSNNSNRMGYRLDGTKLMIDGQQNMVSSGVIPGTLQITQDGSPIILLNDAQTIGGYPRLGILTIASLYQMAHIKPGDRIRFKIV